MQIGNEALRSLCIKNGWFTCGTGRQYDKLFRANVSGWSIKELAAIIWLCSDDDCDPSDIMEKIRREVAL